MKLGNSVLMTKILNEKSGADVNSIEDGTIVRIKYTRMFGFKDDFALFVRDGTLLIPLYMYNREKYNLEIKDFDWRDY